MTKLSTSIIERIKKETRAPIARWHFVARHAAVWLAVGAGMIIASIFIGTLIADIIRADWSLASRWPGREMGFVRDLVMGLWLGGAALAIVGSITFFRLTRRGYRYGIAGLTTLIVGTSIVVGASLLPTPLPDRVRAWHDDALPMRMNATAFHAPAEGRLVGEITDIDTTTYDTVWLEDVQGYTWEVWRFDGNAIPLVIGDFVRVFGETIDDTTFAALTILPIPPHYSVQDFPPMERMYE